MDMRRLYQLLLQRGVVSQEKLNEAVNFYRLFQQSGMGKPFYAILLEKKFIEPDQFAQLGISVGPYRLVKYLGRGNSSYVYQAQHQYSNQIAAIKILTSSGGKKPSQVSRFQREIQIALSLSHPNLVGGIEFGRDQGVRYLALEYIEGETLEEILEIQGRLTEKDALHYITQVARALEYIDSEGLVHRDVKPANIMVLPSGEVKLCDLGLAKWTMDNVKRLTKTGQIVGTPYYVSPELIQAMKGIDIRSDIYSLGATLFHLLTGRPIFDGGNLMSVLNHHLIKSFPSYQELKDQLPMHLYLVLKKMLEKDPEKRYPDVTTLIEDLEEAKKGRNPKGLEKKSLTNSRLRSVRASSNSIYYILALASVMTVGLAVYFTLFSPTPEKKAPSKETKKVVDKSILTPQPEIRPIQKISEGGKKLFVKFSQNMVLQSAGVEVDTQNGSGGFLNEDRHYHYKSKYRCRTLTGKGSTLVIDFTTPQDRPVPTVAHLNLLHHGGSPSSSPPAITVTVNGVKILSNHRPPQVNDNGNFRREMWPMAGHIKKGKNTIRLQVATSLPSCYWIRRLEVNYGLALEGFDYLGSFTYQVGGQKQQVLEFRHRKTGLDFVLLPPSPGGKTLLMSKWEVTQKAWIAVMGRDTEAEENWKKDERNRVGDYYPATYVNWYGANVFCRKGGFQLPTLAQWKWAYRGTGKTRFFWGENWDGDYLWSRQNTGDGSPREDYAHVVGLKKGNAFGLHDMAGNVKEWLREQAHIGGSWQDEKVNLACSDYQSTSLTPQSRHRDLGFRVVVVMGE